MITISRKVKRLSFNQNLLNWLDKRFNNEHLFRCVLAHELGHHFRYAGQHMIAASATGIMQICKAERLATDWAVDLLVPGDEFLRAVQAQLTFQEVMNHFYVFRTS